MKKLLSSILLTLLLALPISASAFDLQVGEELSVKDETIAQNLYTFAGKLFVSSDIDGDLFGAAGDLTVNGNVTKDGFLAAGNLNINGDINEDLRAAAGNMIVSGAVNGDFVVAAGSVHITPDAQLNGDGIINAGYVLIEGPVNGSLIINAGEVEFRSPIAGSVQLTATDNVEFGEEGQIQGNLTYRTIEQIDRIEDEVDGAVEYKQLTDFEKEFRQGLFKVFSIAHLIKVAMGFVAVMVLTIIFRRHFENISNLAYQKPGIGLLKGLGLSIVMPVTIVILFVSVIGIPLGFIVTLLYVLALMLAGFLASVIAGSGIMKLIKKSKKFEVTILGSMLGFIALTLVRFIPVVGQIIFTAIMLGAFGALATYCYQSMFKSKK